MGATSTSIFRGRDQESYLSKAVALTGDTVLTAAEALNKTLKFTGALTGNVTVTFPVSADDTGLTWFINNATTEAHTLTVRGAAFNGGAVSSGVGVTQAKKVVVQWDGTEFVLMTTDK